MKRQKRLLCIILTIFISAIPMIALAAGKHALLIGIQDYSYHPMFPSLKGPANETVEKPLIQTICQNCQNYKVFIYNGLGISYFSNIPELP